MAFFNCLYFICLYLYICKLSLKVTEKCVVPTNFLFRYQGLWIEFGPGPLSPSVASNILHSFGHNGGFSHVGFKDGAY